MVQEPLAEPYLLRTKLRRPRTVGQIVARPRLVELLNGALELPLTLMSAPPGYGKTSLVGQWLDQLASPWGWFSIDQQDNSLGFFATYLSAAITNAYAGYGAAVDALLHSPIPQPPVKLADAFIGELEALPGELVLVLDDYHEINQSDIHAFLSSLIENAPTGVHFILLTRSDPPLKLARLRARRQVLDVRGAQLRFTLAESAELMARVMGESINPEIVTLFTERTEGWAAGLHLAAISMRDSADVEASAVAFARSNTQFIVDYLVSEVLDLLPEQERTLLLYASILRRFCAPLLEAVRPPQVQDLTGDAFLAWLRTSNLFLIALDDEGRWFRFHHLFSDILRHRLQLAADNSTVAQAHLAASRWFEDNALIDEAILHALDAGDAERAARLVEANAEALLNQENRRTFDRWLEILPESAQGRPGLLVLKAWAEQFRYRPQAVLALSQAAEAALTRNIDEYAAADADAILGAIIALRSIAYLFTGRIEQAMEASSQALELVGVERTYIRGLMEFGLLRTTAMLDNPATAVMQAQEWLSSLAGSLNPRILRVLLALCSIYYDQLDLAMLAQTARTYRDSAEQMGQLISIAWTRFLFGSIHYQRNELDAAKKVFAAVLDNPYTAHTRAVIDCATGLALCLHADGRCDEAHAEVAHLRRFLQQGGGVELAAITNFLDEYLDLLAGKAVQPVSAPLLDLQTQLGLDLWVLPSLVRSLAQIRSGSPAQQAEAAATLAEWQQLLARYSIPRRKLEVDLQEALLGALTGDDAAALDALRSAVAIGAKGGVLRMFVDMGPELQPCLQELARQGVEPGYIVRILAAYPTADRTQLATPESFPVLLPARQPAQQPASASALALSAQPGQALLGLDALTNRELDVLLLLDRRLSNKEIGEILFISPFTVKRHTSAIYEKLQVNSRRSAVARARALGLLPPTQT